MAIAWLWETPKTDVWTNLIQTSHRLVSPTQGSQRPIPLLSCAVGGCSMECLCQLAVHNACGATVGLHLTPISEFPSKTVIPDRANLLILSSLRLTLSLCSSQFFGSCTPFCAGWKKQSFYALTSSLRNLEQFHFVKIWLDHLDAFTVTAWPLQSFTNSLLFFLFICWNHRKTIT